LLTDWLLDTTKSVPILSQSIALSLQNAGNFDQAVCNHMSHWKAYTKKQIQFQWRYQTKNGMIPGQLHSCSNIYAISLAHLSSKRFHNNPLNSHKFTHVL
jgi:hypothetical protein